MPVKVWRARSEGSDKSILVGTIDWTPGGWDYKTDDSDLAILLGEVRTEGTVIALSSLDTDEGIFDFIEEKVDASDDRFISGLSSFLLRTTDMWIGVTA